MNITAKLNEYAYNGEVKTLTVENYIHAHMVTLSLDGKRINLDTKQLIEAIQRCDLSYLEED